VTLDSYAECRCAECRILNVTKKFVMLSVIILSVVAPHVVLFVRSFRSNLTEKRLKTCSLQRHYDLDKKVSKTMFLSVSITQNTWTNKARATVSSIVYRDMNNHFEQGYRLLLGPVL